MTNDKRIQNMVRYCTCDLDYQIADVDDMQYVLNHWNLFCVELLREFEKKAQEMREGEV